jgi:microcystin-dependent protein
MSSKYDDLNGYAAGSYIFNPNDFITTSSSVTTEMIQAIANGLDPRYANTEGDTIQGDITLNSLVVINGINFSNELPYAIQTQAFTTAHKDSIALSTSKTKNLSIDSSGNTVLSKSLVFSDGTIQTTAPNNSANNTKLTDISYDGGLLKTTIGNTCHINNLTCGNINTSHLSGTTSNLQNQINSIASNNITATSTFTNTPITINNSNFDTTIAKYDQPNYEDLKFHNAITLQAISTDRTFFIGSLSDASNGAVAQFMIGANGGGVPDPDILMSLSRDAVYFFGVKQPLVPVGTIQIYAGTESPNGYLMCQGQLVSKTTYNLLWDLIGNTFLNGRTASSTHFYLPDLRQMFIKGAGTNTTYEFKVPVESASLGKFQEMSVQKHKHQYEDRGAASKTVSTSGAGSTIVADNITEIWYTKEGIVRPDPDNLNIGMEDNETRPNTLVMNYIIKF